MCRRNRVIGIALFVLGILIAMFIGGCGESIDSEQPPRPTPLAKLPEPESFGAVPAPTGIRIKRPELDLAKPSSDPPPSDYSVVGPNYTAVHDLILSNGREIVDLLISGDALGVQRRFHTRLRGNMTERRILDRLDELKTDRIHFEVNAIGAMFDGHVNNGEIAGGYVDETITASFYLKAIDNNDDIKGGWKGNIFIDNERTLPIEIVFGGEGNDLTGTLAFPDQGHGGIPLGAISYDKSRLIGESIVDIATIGLYGSDLKWGKYILSVWLTFDSSGNLIGLETTPRRPLKEHPSTEYKSPTKWRLPVEGIWWVNYGGPTYLQNVHARIPAKRYSYDFAIWRDGAFFRGSGSTNTDYHSFGQRAVAPCEGTVIAVVDGIPDNEPGQPNSAVHPAGNHLVIRTESDEYVVLSHLQMGSIRVVVDDDVNVGDVLGLVGNSGQSSVPHLHFYVQDQQDVLSPIALGLPISFYNYYSDGELISTGVPIQGQLIQQAD